MELARVFAEFTGRVNVTLVILAGALLMARILPVVVLSPFLGEDSTPTEVKIGISLILTVVLFPGIEPRMSQVPITALPFMGLLLKEIFIGFALAFIVSMVFEAAIAAGTLIDLVGGGSQATMFLPELNMNVSLFANLKTQLAVVLFHTLNGHHQIINALADSVVLIPVDRFPEFSNGVWPFFDLIARAFVELFRIGVELAAPVVLTTILVDLGLGAINRVAPQIGVYFISLSIKPLAAVFMVFLGLHLIVDRLNEEFVLMLRMFREAIRLMV